MSTWIMGADGYPTNTSFISMPEHMTDPIPKGMWRIDAHYNEGYPFHEMLLDVPMDYGAFENSDIERVRVPISVKTIGAYAFSNTKLRHVRIAADATISSTSVPEGCIVNRYPDDRYEQLTDEQGRMVLDRDARRILLRRIDD